MQNLATDVGNLQRVLTNVSTRGAWGEVQLGAILEQILSPDQYSQNVQPHRGPETVEYAVRLPGNDENPDTISGCQLILSFLRLTMTEFVTLLRNPIRRQSNQQPAHWYDGSISSGGY